jgi:hypothetical protein
VLQLYVPMNEKMQREWFDWAKVKMPKDKKLKYLALYGIAYWSKNNTADELNTLANTKIEIEHLGKIKIKNKIKVKKK